MLHGVAKLTEPIATTNAISNPTDGPIVNYQMNAVGNYAVQTLDSNFGLFTFEGPDMASTSSQLFFWTTASTSLQTCKIFNSFTARTILIKP